MTSQLRISLKFKYVLVVICTLAVTTLHLLSVTNPYFHEDEGIYYNFGLTADADFQNGILWKALSHISQYFHLIDGLKVISLILGLITFFIMVKVSSNVISFLFAVAFALSPVFFSQFHRFRPEALHTCIAVLSFLCLYYAAKEMEDSKSSRRWLFVGMLVSFGILHTHIMAAWHLPALFLMIVYICWNSFKKPLLVLLAYAALYIFQFMLFQPIFRKHGLAYLKTISGSQVPNIKLRWLDPIRIVLENSKVWFIDTISEHSFFSHGHHLYILTAFILVAFGSLLATRILCARKSFLQKNNFVTLACAANVILFIVSIFFFKRINNSYLLVPTTWLFLFFILNLKDHTKKAIAFSFPIVTIIICISLTHLYYFIWPERISFFKENVTSIRQVLDQDHCTKIPYVSAPYFPFFYSQDAADLSKTNNNNTSLEQMLRPLPVHSCIVIHARHLWGYEFFSQYNMTNLRKKLNANFKLIKTLELPFYDDTAKLYEKASGKILLPVGSDYLYYHGKEILYFYDRSEGSWQDVTEE